MATTTDDRVLLRPEQVAEWLSVSRGRVYELIAAGDLRSVKIGRARRITVAAVREFVADLESV